MAVTTTVTAQEVLIAVADETGDVQSSFVDDVNSATIRAAGLSLGADVNFQYGLAYIAGKGIRSVSAYYEADNTIVCASAFSPVATVGDIVSVYWWDPKRRAQAQQTVNRAISASYPFWYREVILDLNNTTNSVGATVTADELAADDFEYALPADCVTLIRVGAQANATDEPNWTAPLRIWKQVGQEGAFKVRFNPHLTNWVGEHSGKTLCFHYEAREPVFSTFTASDTTQLPLNYFKTAAAALKRQWAQNADQPNLQLLMFDAATELGRLGYVRKPLPRGPRMAW